MEVGVSLEAGKPAAAPWGMLYYGVPALLVLGALYRAAERCWLGPRRVAGALQGQGLRGTAYRFLLGDLREFGRLNEEAWSSAPLPLGCHDIVPRVTPFVHRNVRDNGRPCCFSWFGPIPSVTITDPAQVRDVLSNKLGHFEKPKLPALTKLLADGLTSHDGEKWVKHRRIMNPAFHLEKLKVHHVKASHSYRRTYARLIVGLYSNAVWVDL